MNTTTNNKPLNEETSHLIPANKVEGTAVFGANGDKIGSVDTVMLDKRDGKVRSAILSIGGFLGIGDKLHSVPWTKLDYDKGLDGYKLDVTKEKLRDAPNFDRSNRAMSSDAGFQRRSNDYFGERMAA